LHSLHSHLSTPRVFVPLCWDWCFFLFLFMVYKTREAYISIDTALWLGARLPWSGCCVLNTRSLLLCLHPKPSFVLHDGICNIKSSICRLVSRFKIMLNFLVVFSNQVVVVICCNIKPLISKLVSRFYIVLNSLVLFSIHVCCSCTKCLSKEFTFMILQWYVEPCLFIVMLFGAIFSLCMHSIFFITI
jgi:hypothetical protein